MDYPEITPKTGDYVYLWDKRVHAFKVKVERIINAPRVQWFVVTSMVNGHQDCVRSKEFIMFAHEKGPNWMKWDGEAWRTTEARSVGDIVKEKENG